MKEYLIYHKDKYVGHTDNKDMLKAFLKSRKLKYDIVKVKSSKIPKRISSTIYFENTMLVYYEGYGGRYEQFPIFIYEQSEIEQNIINDGVAFGQFTNFLLDNMKYLKLSKEEEKLIKNTLLDVLGTLEAIVYGEHEVIYDEIIDMNKYLNYNLKNNTIRK